MFPLPYHLPLIGKYRKIISYLGRIQYAPTERIIVLFNASGGVAELLYSENSKIL